MAFLGAYPYGTDRGTDTAPAGQGLTTVQGIGQGVQFTLAIDGPLSIRDQRTYIEISRIYGQVNTGAGMATITVTANGITIDSAAGTLNFNPSPDNSFKLTAAAGVDSIALNYHATGGIYGTTLQPAMIDHTHASQFPGLFHVEYSAPTSGTMALSTTAGQVGAQAVTIPMPNDGRSYVVGGRASYSIYGSSTASIGVSVNGAAPRYYIDSNEVNPAERVVEDWATVVGTGQNVVVAVWGKLNTGTGWFGSGQLIARYDAKPLIAG